MICFFSHGTTQVNDVLALHGRKGERDVQNVWCNVMQWFPPPQKNQFFAPLVDFLHNHQQRVFCAMTKNIRRLIPTSLKCKGLCGSGSLTLFLDWNCRLVRNAFFVKNCMLTFKITVRAKIFRFYSDTMPSVDNCQQLHLQHTSVLKITESAKASEASDSISH